MARLTDTFSYSNGSLPTVSSSAWSNVGQPDITVTNGRATANATGTIFANSRPLGFTPSGPWEIGGPMDHGSNTGATDGITVWLLDGSFNGYGFYLSGDNIGLVEVAGGTGTDLVTIAGAPAAGDHNYWLSRTAGGLLTLYRGPTTLGSATDTTYSSPTQIVLIISSNSSTTYPSIDSIYAQDYITVSRIPTRRQFRSLTFR